MPVVNRRVAGSSERPLFAVFEDLKYEENRQARRYRDAPRQVRLLLLKFSQNALCL